MHECPECGESCGCDGEDHGQDAPDDCVHNCDPGDEYDDPVISGLDYSDDED